MTSSSESRLYNSVRSLLVNFLIFNRSVIMQSLPSLYLFKAHNAFQMARLLQIDVKFSRSFAGIYQSVFLLRNTPIFTLGMDKIADGLMADGIVEEIFRLRDQKEQSERDSHHREEGMNQIKELQDFIAGQETDITEFDEALVKKLIEKITVFADHFSVEFKSVLAIDIEHKKAPRRRRICR